jgi:phosphoglycolate phosphatase
MGVIFDLDGTLVDSLDDIAAAMDHVLDTLELPRRTRAEYERFVGDGARLLVRRALGGRVDLEDEALAAFRARYVARMTVHTRPFAGIEALLAELAARGVRTAVLSNKPHAATVQLVRALFPTHAFVAVLGQRDEHERKPSPDGAFEIARAMGEPPRGIHFVGDTPVDMETARAAGMIPVGVLWGMRSRAELERAGAACLLTTPAELLALL